MATITEEAVLDHLRTMTCEHTGEIAEEFGVAPSTARGVLDRLERRGLVSGTKHDERDLFDGGRIRIYWSPT